MSDQTLPITSSVKIDPVPTQPTITPTTFHSATNSGPTMITESIPTPASPSASSTSFAQDFQGPSIPPKDETPVTYQPAVGIGGTTADVPPPPPVDDSSLIMSSPPPKKMGKGGMLGAIFGVVILIVGLAVGLILVKKNQDIRQRAASNCDASNLNKIECQGGFLFQCQLQNGNYVWDPGDHIACTPGGATCTPSYECSGTSCVAKHARPNNSGGCDDVSGVPDSNCNNGNGCGGNGGGGGNGSCDGKPNNTIMCREGILQQCQNGRWDKGDRIPCNTGGQTCSPTYQCSGTTCVAKNARPDSNEPDGCADVSGVPDSKCNNGSGCGVGSGSCGDSGQACCAPENNGGKICNGTLFCQNGTCQGGGIGGQCTSGIGSGTISGCAVYNCPNGCGSDNQCTGADGVSPVADPNCTASLSGCGQIDWLNQGGIYCGTKAVNCSASCASTSYTYPTPGSYATPSTYTTPPTTNAQCTNIKVYKVTGEIGNAANWSLLTLAQMQGLKSGDTIYITTLGSVTNGHFNKARIRVNSSSWSADDETTNTKPKAHTGDPKEFYVTYTIPDGTTTFTFASEIFESETGKWF